MRRRRLGAANEEYANTKLLTTRLVYCPFRERKVGRGNVDLDGGSEVPLSCECELVDTEDTRRKMIGILKSLKM